MPNDIDRLQTQIAVLFKEMQRLSQIEADQTRLRSDCVANFGASDERIDNIEKHCEAMQGRWDKLQPHPCELPLIDPSRIYYTRNGIKVTGLKRISGGRLAGDVGGNPDDRYVWFADGRLLPGKDSPEDVMLAAHAPDRPIEPKFESGKCYRTVGGHIMKLSDLRSDRFVGKQELSAAHEATQILYETDGKPVGTGWDQWTLLPGEFERVLFEAYTDQRGVVRLEQWSEGLVQGLVLWHHGSIVWRSWKYRD